MCELFMPPGVKQGEHYLLLITFQRPVLHLPTYTRLRLNFIFEVSEIVLIVGL